MSETKDASDEMERRTVKLTTKALAYKINTLQHERHTAVKKLKGLTREIKELMKRDANAKDVQWNLERLIQLFECAKTAHESVIVLLPEEDQETQNDWFARINKYHTGFVEDVKQWLFDNERHSMQTGHVTVNLPAADSDTSSILHEKAPVESKEEIPPQDNPPPDLTSKATSDVQELIQPSDSVSNVASSRKSKHSASKASSKASSTSSARIKAEADVAALVVRQKMLKDKHALEEQEELIRKKKEQLELEADIAATMAKVHVLGASRGSSVQSHPTKMSDDMMSYFEKYQGKRALDVEAKAFVPNTQNIQLHGQSLPDQNITNLQPIIGAATAHTAATHTQPSNTDPRTLNSTIMNAGDHAHVTTPAILPTSNSGEQNNIYSVMDKQNEITALLIHQQCLSSMPKREIQVFDGDPLQYQTFIKSFEHSIESKNENYRDRLYYLEQYTRGQPREIVRSCLHMDSDRGYRKAKALLQEHFGNEHKIARAYMDKALAWPSIKPDDTKSLQAYTLFLQGCCNAMEDVNYMKELDMPSNMLIIIKKLPYRLRDKWRTVACDFQVKYNQRATFKDVVDFLERQVRILTDPVFGDIKDTPAVSKEIRRFKSQPQPRIKGSIFATTVTLKENNGKGTKEREGLCGLKSCLFCEGGHGLDMCSKLEKKTQDEKIAFMRENGICFGCLGKGHLSRDCRKRLTCDICGLKHPRMLHIHQRKKEMDTQQTETKDTARRSAVASVQTSGLTGAGEDNCKLSIVPVQVKAKKGSAIVQTYAFLDPGSTASFCTVGLMTKLKLQGRRSSILLRTMGQRKVVGTNIVSGLEVAGLDSSHFCDLPGIYTQKTMPVHQGNIPHQKDIEQWSHLNNVHLPKIESEIELLIGLDVPRALEPLDVIRSVGDGPYAVKTMLGWTVNGPLGKKDDDAQEQSTVNANRISVVKLDVLWEQQFRNDFPECVREDKEPSKEDKMFLDLVSQSTRLVDGHYCINLPLKEKEICLPDNRSVAEQRTLNLKKRFKRDPSFHSE